MKITQRQLRQIIQEEIVLLRESGELSPDDLRATASMAANIANSTVSDLKLKIKNPIVARLFLSAFNQLFTQNFRMGG